MEGPFCHRQKFPVNWIVKCELIRMVRVLAREVASELDVRKLAPLRKIFFNFAMCGYLVHLIIHSGIFLTIIYLGLNERAWQLHQLPGSY
jgi:hypothetical protein